MSVGCDMGAAVLLFLVRHYQGEFDPAAHLTQWAGANDHVNIHRYISPMTPPDLRAIFQWDVHSWSRALPLWEDHLPKARPFSALGIGERDGGLSLWLASKGGEVTCTDLGPPSQAAKELHTRYSLQDHITYAQADVTDLPFADGTFDVVVFKSVIGALGTTERQMVAMHEMHRVLKPGGVLLFAENLGGTWLHGWLRRRYVAWNTYWRYLEVRADQDLFASFARTVSGTTGFLANLGRTEGQRDVLSKVDAVILPLVPRSMRTIWFGSAVKGDR